VEVASDDDVGHAFHVDGDECFHAMSLGIHLAGGELGISTLKVSLIRLGA
jgi:hypothetical protein